jgi:hypothetical protein
MACRSSWKKLVRWNVWSPLDRLLIPEVRFFQEVIDNDKLIKGAIKRTSRRPEVLEPIPKPL